MLSCCIRAAGRVGWGGYDCLFVDLHLPGGALGFIRLTHPPEIGAGLLSIASKESTINPHGLHGIGGYTELQPESRGY